MSLINWNEISTPALIAWGALLLAFFWSIWHDFIKLLGYSPFSIEKVREPENIEPDKNGPEFCSRHQELLKLGFKPLGTIQASLGKAFTVEETVYGNGPKGIMAEIGSATKSVYFVSSSRQGNTMSTGDVPADLDAVGPGYQRKYNANLTVTELFEQHRKEMPGVLGHPDDLLSTNTIEEIMEVQRCFETHPCSTSMIRSTARSMVSQMLLWVGVPTGAVALFAGVNSPWPGLSGTAVALFLGFGNRLLSEHSFGQQELAGEDVPHPDRHET